MSECVGTRRRRRESERTEDASGKDTRRGRVRCVACTVALTTTPHTIVLTTANPRNDTRPQRVLVSHRTTSHTMAE